MVLNKVRVTMAVGPVPAKYCFEIKKILNSFLVLSDPKTPVENDRGVQGTKLEHDLTVSKIVEQKEFLRKDSTIAETLSFSPELSTVNYLPVMCRKRNFHEVRDYKVCINEQGGYRRHQIRT